LIEISKERRQPGNPMYRFKDNIEMDLKGNRVDDEVSGEFWPEIVKGRDSFKD
jgi:hypothetical protein